MHTSYPIVPKFELCYLFSFFFSVPMRHLFKCLFDLIWVKIKLGVVQSVNHNNNNDTERCNSRLFTTSSLHCKMPPPYMLKWKGCSRVQITCTTSDAYHVQHAACPMKGQLSYEVWQSCNSIYFSFTSLAETINQQRRGGKQNPHRKKTHMLQKMPHTTAQKFKPQPRLESAL